MQLRRQEGQQLQHVFRLAVQGYLKAFLRVTFSGLLLGHTTGMPCLRGTPLPAQECRQDVVLHDLCYMTVLFEIPDQ